MAKITTACGVSVFDRWAMKTRRFPLTTKGWRLASRYAQRIKGRAELAIVCRARRAPTIIGSCTDGVCQFEGDL